MKRLGFVGGSLLLLCCGGCVEVSRSADGVSMSYQSWVPVVWSLVCLAIAGLGYLMMKDQNGYYSAKGGGFFSGALIILIGVIPTTLSSHASVTREGVDIDSRLFWFLSSSTDVRFSDLASISYTGHQYLDKQGRQTDDYKLVFKRKNGTEDVVKIDHMVSDLMPELEKIAKAKKVPMTLPVIVRD